MTDPAPQLAYQPPSTNYPSDLFVLTWLTSSASPLPTRTPTTPRPDALTIAPWFVALTCQ